MKRRILQLICLIAMVLAAYPALAGWKEKVTRNQMLAREYIGKLIAGEDPDTLQRPPLRRVEKYQAKRANREIREAMERAEELARAGRHEEIEEPVFTFKGIDSDRYEALQKEKSGSKQ